MHSSTNKFMTTNTPTDEREVACCEHVESVKARKDAAIIETKKLRVEFDGSLQNLRKAMCNRSSRERSIAVTKLQEAIMWLGMDLKDLDAPTPYPNSYNPTNTIVDKTADGLKL